MIKEARKVRSLVREHGLSETLFRLVDYVYMNYVRDRVPYRDTRFHGVRIPANTIFDPYFSPDIEHDRPLYETTLGSAITRCVSPGDAVVVVGAGWGVSSVLAAQAATETGRVTAYEASDEFANKIEQTLRLNPVPATVEVRNRAVGPVKHIYGDEEYDEKATGRKKELPECDVLVLDCEGAETSILADLEIEPEIIIVESHGLFDSPTRAVKDQLSQLGYEMETEYPAEFGTPHFENCIENDVYVITARAEHGG